MTEEVKLSTRLLKVASFLPKGANFADIGSDHAYLPCFICKQDSNARAIAGEVNEGPLSSAIETVKTNHLGNQIDVRLGDGLAVLKKGEVEQVVIAGMGGTLISSILEDGKDKLEKVRRIISQPNVDEKSVRKWYGKNGYQIVEEVILEEKGHIYEIIVGEKSSQTVRLTEKELLFGPLLLKERSPLFYKKWKHAKQKRLHVLEQLKQARTKDKVKISCFMEQISWIEEVLDGDEEETNE